MAYGNRDVARVFLQIANLLDIQGGEPYRARAYREAARVVDGLPFDVAAAARQVPPPKIPGIGADLYAKAREIGRSGTCATLRELRRRLPLSLSTLLDVPGMGPGRVRTVHAALGIATRVQLRRAATAGRLRAIRGFGAKLEAAIAAALAAGGDKARRFPRAAAEAHAVPLVQHLRAVPGVDQVVLAGSLRREQATVGDLDVLVTASRSKPVMAHLARYARVRRMTVRGLTRATAELDAGLTVDVRVVKPASLGAALAYFTGPKEHNVALRQLARTKGLKISEYGVYKGNRRVAGATEESVYAAVGLAWVPPSQRRATLAQAG